ncbi:hypothetical protein SK355_13955 [Candidatus Fukatsuia symbiotica]|uniref:Uncharacterized protein n=2 Tax=Candidatus Fukatsuia symbiotica TaxID=1878942 RepID=A0A2U8IB70_9GAMM|nr:hypothetical protein [Candidatus Fukatsuia symbiotica]AWK15594.1 hypothetical protein CCS41_14315 [Candidatus Fukatsuia symbiotica]MEA9446252.1 hypothetical protein [Candidatus Fukatsuia symbiotica]
MSTRKQQKELDKAIVHLMKYAEEALWSERKKQFFDDILMDAANGVDISVSELIETLGEGYLGMAFSYLFELFATSCWNNEKFCMIEDYVKRRGWRETPYATRYLNALAKSEVRLWEVVTVNVGQWAEVRPFGTTSTVLRVYERSGTQNLKRWDCIATSVILLDGKPTFGGGILPFSQEQAQDFPVFLEYAHRRVIEELKEIRADDQQCSWSDEEINLMASSEESDPLSELLFSFWICETYLALTKPMPTLVNRDGHLLQWSKVRFPVAPENQDEIERRLHTAPHLDFDSNTKEWLWFDGEKDKVRDFGTTILGQLSLVDDSLIATVNSVERAETVKAYLNDLLGKLIGNPLSVHENVQSMMENYSTKNLPPAEPLDVPELITASLDQHYRKILDEPIPALNNLTPRECVQKSDQQVNLIQWLKSLENNTARAPHMAHYDFTWMWQELGIEEV